MRKFIKLSAVALILIGVAALVMSASIVAILAYGDTLPYLGLLLPAGAAALGAFAGAATILAGVTVYMLARIDGQLRGVKVLRLADLCYRANSKGLDVDIPF